MRKERGTIRSLLGITQEQLAMILGVTRSQLSMYEVGKRSLPTPATLLLVDILRYVQANEANAKQQPLSREQQAALKNNKKFRLAENEYRRSKLERQIAATAKKLEASQRKALVTEFLEIRAGKKSAAAAESDRRANGTLSKTLLEQQHHLKLLELEKQLLEEN